MIDANKQRTLQKIMRFPSSYDRYRYTEVAEIPMQMLPAGGNFRLPPDDCQPWRPAEHGAVWGGDGGYAWFRGSYTVPEHLAGHSLWLRSLAGEAEGLLFIDGTPRGMFDFCPDVGNPQNRLHILQPLVDAARGGQTFTVALEGYAGHRLCGTMPFDSEGCCTERPYPYNLERTYGGIYVVEPDDNIQGFLNELEVLLQLYRFLDDGNYVKWQVTNVLEELFVLLPQMPWEHPKESWYGHIAQARACMAEVLSDKRVVGEKSQFGEFGLIGHSHLDTAWLWPVEETLHKAARTFSNALSVMERYPDYRFIQSSVLYIDWMKKEYPAIYEGIRRRTAEGRWEPNGGSWVECDCNITGGEAMIRQFLRGQRYLRENLQYQADAFWLPDTFGYSAAIPQILQGCGIRYFLTTKLSWNEANPFPHDTFVWKGIDGSEVLTHFNLTHCWPSPETLITNARHTVRHKDDCGKKLLAYGFGDGGGGPSYTMAEMARTVQGLRCLPDAAPTTVSAFMQRLEQDRERLPVYDGELYLELHRGTLTQMHDIKRSNRKAEIALHNLELINVHTAAVCGAAQVEETAGLYDTLMLNQFHDILPGTTLPGVHDKAIKENYAAAQRAQELTNQLLGTDEEQALTVYNPLSFSWDTQITVPDEGLVPTGRPWQRFTALDGSRRLAIGSMDISPLASVCVAMENAEETFSGASPFHLEEDILDTPFARVRFAPDGGIVSFIDKREDRELVADPTRPLNRFYMGEDIPCQWDNWDIDYDQRRKMQPQTRLLSRETMSAGPLQFRIRQITAIGEKSVLRQDIIFYADSPRVDFETEVDWQDIHSLLKTSFPLQIRTAFARHEIQFGYVQRPVTENTSQEKSRFEVCNHKWTDLSENRYGVSLLNDCKYGISVDGHDVRLTLLKGGCRPDPRGDVGTHAFTYALLPHDGGFCADTVVRGGYALNNPPLAVYGAAAPLPSFAQTDVPNIILETVKFAEDGNGYILRLYEAECTASHCTLTLGIPVRAAVETNMLEDALRELPCENGQIELRFRPFEIKTIRLLPEENA